LNDFWMTYEIAGVSLVDMEIWHWMYNHPDAKPAECKTAMLQIAQDIWNKYYAPVFKTKDVVLLGIYSHIIHSFLYIPDYAIGHLISHQIDEQIKKGSSVGIEVERMVKSGSIAPDLWMKNATGVPVGSEAMLNTTERALKEYRK
jgi:oligoendopeptidase F